LKKAGAGAGPPNWENLCRWERNESEGRNSVNLTGWKRNREGVSCNTSLMGGANLAPTFSIEDRKKKKRKGGGKSRDPRGWLALPKKGETQAFVGRGGRGELTLTEIDPRPDCPLTGLRKE